MKQRADECILALDKLTEINSGVAVQNVLQTEFDWTTLEVTLHRFGFSGFHKRNKSELDTA